MNKVKLILAAAILLPVAAAAQSRLSVGGYGEVAFSRNFYSDNVYRYSSASSHVGEQHGRFDVPHAVIFLGYDLGGGWKMQTEIEFEHLGTGTEIEKEFEEAGEWEAETERGGEVELEQFWLEKSFFPQLNVRAGHIVVPVGGLNNAHEPLNFFTVYRSEGEFTILPSTWHDTGISIWGEAGTWRYEAQVLSGLDAMMFSRDNFIKNGAHTPFEFQVANTLGFAGRLDKSFMQKALRLGLSGYAGNTLRNTFPYEELTNSYIKDATGTLLLGAFDLRYNGKRLIVRGNADYGHLSDAGPISKYKGTKGAAASAPYSDTPVGDKAVAAGIEAGYDILPFFPGRRDKEQKFYLFGRLEYYNSYIPQSGQGSFGFTGKTRVALGVNWFPIPEVAVKAEWSKRYLAPGYNDEPSVNLGVAYQAFFKR